MSSPDPASVLWVWKSQLIEADTRFPFPLDQTPPLKVTLWARPRPQLGGCDLQILVVDTPDGSRGQQKGLSFGSALTHRKRNGHPST